ncbi:MAG: S4 domain-containing protein [Melioribacteraceae bacterium]|nr:S4 domain-containing protein [Melioribacteraceae bacterium]
MTQTSTKTRLNKYLSECGIASRRKSEEFIKQERITINGRVVSDFSYEVTEDDLVKFDGEVVRPEKKVYFILNKPKGFITTTADEKKEKPLLI